MNLANANAQLQGYIITTNPLITSESESKAAWIPTFIYTHFSLKIKDNDNQ